MNHKDRCKCESCRDGLEAVRQRDAEAMKKYGWVCHLVSDDNDAPYGISCHTHGLPEKFGHPDLQICFPADAPVLHRITCNAVDKIKKGKKFKECGEEKELIQNYAVLTVGAKEDGRDVFRIILPDKEGNLKPEEIDERMRCQYKGTPYLLYTEGLSCENCDDDS